MYEALDKVINLLAIISLCELFTVGVIIHEIIRQRKNK